MTRPSQRPRKSRSPGYAAEYGIGAASRHFKTKQGLELKENIVRGWKKMYCAELASQKKGVINPWKNFLCKHWDAYWH